MPWGIHAWKRLNAVRGCGESRSYKMDSPTARVDRAQEVAAKAAATTCGVLSAALCDELAFGAVAPKGRNIAARGVAPGLRAHCHEKISPEGAKHMALG